MKKTAIALAVALAGFATVAQAAPKDDSWYVGGKLGWSHYISNSLNVAGLSTNDHPNQLGAGAFFGYQANPYLGFEMGYDWLGRMGYAGDFGGIFRSQGVQLAAKLSYPLMDNLDVYTRLGGMVWRSDIHGSTGNTYASADDSGVSPLAAIGVEYALNKDWATRLDYQYVSNIGTRSETFARPDNTMLSLGIVYRFGQDEMAAAPALVPAPVVETKRFTLKSDVLFNFNKYTLKAEGRQALDQLYNQLSSMDPKDGSVVVLGYTDRIGSEQYNMNLSKQRAQTVVDYLVSKGIPADKITARGMGKADPVTGATCDNMKPRTALINCLAPDRRVIIEVKGIKDDIIQPQA